MVGEKGLNRRNRPRRGLSARPECRVGFVFQNSNSTAPALEKASWRYHSWSKSGFAPRRFSPKKACFFAVTRGPTVSEKGVATDYMGRATSATKLRD